MERLTLDETIDLARRLEAKNNKVTAEGYALETGHCKTLLSAFFDLCYTAEGISECAWRGDEDAILELMVLAKDLDGIVNSIALLIGLPPTRPLTNP